MQRLIALMAVFYLIHVYSSNPGLASLPLILYLKETLHLEANGLAIFQTVAFLPWVIKPAYGLIIDRFPLFGYQTKGYLLTCFGLTTALFLGLGSIGSYSLIALVIGSVAVSTCIAFSDVVADKLMVVEGQRRGKTDVLQAAQWTAFGLGGAVMQYTGGWLAERFSLSVAFLCSAIAPLMGLLAILLLLKERKVEEQKLVAQTGGVRKLWAAMKSRQFLAIAGFVICFGLVPTPPVFFYVRDTLKFTESFIGTLGAIQFLGMGLGALAFGIMSQRIEHYHPLAIAVGFNVITILSFSLMRDRDTAIFVHFFSGLTSMISVLGLFDYVARACPVGNEGTIYAAIVSVNNLAGNLGFVLGSWMYVSHVEFYLIAIAGAILTGLCWFLIPFLKLEKLQ
jgi:MFS family permease